jgi:hypothetical protein
LWEFDSLIPNQKGPAEHVQLVLLFSRFFSMNRNAPLSRFTASVQKPQIETAEHFILWFCETLFKQQNQDRPANASPFGRGGIAKQ